MTSAIISIFLMTDSARVQYIPNILPTIAIPPLHTSAEETTDVLNTENFIRVTPATTDAYPRKNGSNRPKKTPHHPRRDIPSVSCPNFRFEIGNGIFESNRCPYV